MSAEPTTRTPETGHFNTKISILNNGTPPIVQCTRPHGALPAIPCSRYAQTANYFLSSRAVVVAREGIMTTVMVVEDDPAFLTRFCKIVASIAELELFAAVIDVASARQAMSKATPDVLLTD